MFSLCLFSVTVKITMQQLTGQTVQPALTGTCATYERRRPEATVLYQLVAERAKTFFAQVEAKTGTGLPDFVKAEFEALSILRFVRSVNGTSLYHYS